MISTIELQKKIIEEGLCVNCGACGGMCPYWQSFEGRTFKCYDCDRTDGRCLHFCPVLNDTEAELTERFFENENIIDGLGAVRGLYIARATDSTIREKSQHGGTVTALIKLALSERFMDAALLTKTIDGEPQGVIVTDPEEVINCAGSSFKIPASLSVLNKALSENKYGKIGVVGTPCKTRAVYNMKAQPFAENNNHAENIGLVIGLFCGWGLDWNGLTALERKYGFEGAPSHEDIPPSKYHRMELDDVNVELDEVYPLVRNACKHCDDMTARLSDISVGGSRSPEGWDVDKHFNQVIIRTEAGEKLFKLAVHRGLIEAYAAPSENLDKLKKAALSKKSKAL